MTKNSKILVGILVAAIVIVGGVFAYQKLVMQPDQSNQVACTMEAKQCPDGSYVGRGGPNCEFAKCPVAGEKTYVDSNYGFQMTFLNSWNGYLIIKDSWTGHKLDGSDSVVTGPLVIFRNPNWTEQKHYQDIPIMVFTKDIWNLVVQEKIAVSAAPIGPAKIGENANYVFATPPRWHGFEDNLNQQEAVEIAETFKAL